MQNRSRTITPRHPSFTSLRTLQPSFGLTAALALTVLAAASLSAADSPGPTDSQEKVRSAPTEAEGELAGTLETTTPSEVVATTEKQPSIYDKIWGYTKWYKDDENKVIQRFDFVGRFQADYANVNSDQGHYNAWNIRRFRLGAEAQFFQDFIAHVEVDLDPQEGQTYQGLTDAYVAWAPSKNYEFTIGKQSAAFTMDGQTSSKKLLTLERNNLANNIWFTEEYAPGFTVTGEPGKWVYQAGIFSSGVSDSEFGNVSGGVFGLGTVGYDFDEALGVKEALLRLNYVYNAPENTDSGSLFANRPLEQIASLNFSLDAGKWGVRTDLGGALGYGDAGDLWGAMIMPYYNLSDHFQVVTRYTYVSSPDNSTVRLNRYENQVVSKKGNNYQEWYLGLNWYLYGQKLKFQTGVDYAHMADDSASGSGYYNGWGWTTGFRMSW
jgi:phosphate-selective porin OprO/OprP